MVIIASPPWLGVREPEVTYLILKRFHLTYRTPRNQKKKGLPRRALRPFMPVPRASCFAARYAQTPPGTPPCLFYGDLIESAVTHPVGLSIHLIPD
jgi:hypothetical protein